MIKSLTFGLATRARFYAAMASYLEAGIAPYMAVERMLSVAGRRRRQRGIAKVYASLVRRISNGMGVVEAMSIWVPPTEAAMMASGEASNSLSSSLRELNGLLETQVRLKKILRTALVSSAVLVAALLGNVYYILGQVVPQSRALLPESAANEMLFAPTYFAFGEALLRFGPIAAIVFGTFMFVALWSLSQWTSSARQHVEGWLLPWSLYRRVQSAFFLSSVSAMMRAGMPMQGVLEDLRKHSSSWMRHHINRVLRGLSAGKGEAEALDTGMLPDDVVDQLRIYSLLPSFAAVMHELARTSMASFEERVVGLSKTIQVTILLFVAIFIVATIFALGEVAITISTAVSQHTRGV